MQYNIYDRNANLNEIPYSVILCYQHLIYVEHWNDGACAIFQPNPVRILAKIQQNLLVFIYVKCVFVLLSFYNFVFIYLYIYSIWSFYCILISFLMCVWPFRVDGWFYPLPPATFSRVLGSIIRNFICVFASLFRLFDWFFTPRKCLEDYQWWESTVRHHKAINGVKSMAEMRSSPTNSNQGILYKLSSLYPLKSSKNCSPIFNGLGFGDFKSKIIIQFVRSL